MLDADAIRDLLAAWYHARRRELPWREDPTPYRVWISEIMAQQTQIATVIPYFERFMAAFPDVHALAAAPEQEVLSLWAGLGYYRRARHLHAAAKAVVAEHGGELPRTAKALQTLPGIGRYTAGAIASVAFGERAPVVDGNVARVLSRLLALQTPVDASAGQKTLWAVAKELVDPDDPSSHNQAMMELGALVCSPRSPDCALCPIRQECRAAAEGAPEAYPKKKPRKPPTPMHEVAGLLRRDDGAVLLARRPSDALLGGLWELPGGAVPRRGSRIEALRAAWSERVGVEADVGSHRASVEHVFSHRRLTLEVYEVHSVHGTPRHAWYSELRWQPAGQLADVPLSKLSRKVFAAVGLEV